MRHFGRRSELKSHFKQSIETGRLMNTLAIGQFHPSGQRFIVPGLLGISLAVGSCYEIRISRPCHPLAPDYRTGAFFC